MIYKVKSGDTLTAIAGKYNTSVQEIQRANPDLIKDVNKIRIGWELTIPTPSAEESFKQLFQQAVEKVAEIPEVKELMRYL